MTLSYHQFQEAKFFPNSGGPESPQSIFRDCNNINVPLKVGCDDFHFEHVFFKITDSVVEMFRPEAIVLQCGADSLVGDTLGGFNLTIEGHGNVFNKVLGYNLPTLCLGGGGYNMENVGRCWTYESSIALGQKLSDSMPGNLRFAKSFSQKSLLAALPNKHGIFFDENKIDYLENLIEVAVEKLKRVCRKTPRTNEMWRRLGESQESNASIRKMKKQENEDSDEIIF